MKNLFVLLLFLVQIKKQLWKKYKNCYILLLGSLEIRNQEG